MKIINNSNDVEAEVADSLAELLINAGGWRAADAPAEAPAKPVRKRAPRKAPADDQA
jgi:hypothetical protein